MDAGATNASLDRLADLAGIEPEYWDIWGQRHSIGPRAKRRLLAALIGLPPDGDDAAIAGALDAMVEADWQRPLPAVVIARLGEAIPLRLVLPGGGTGTIAAVITEQSGKVHEVVLTLNDDAAPERRRVGGREMVRYALTISLPLPVGYHRIALDLGPAATARLFVAPKQCYLPAELTGDGKVWGLSTQLYSLRRDGDWGVGDYTALGELIAVAEQLGAALVGVNPLHALFLDAPEKASPYSPSSRLYLNALYLDVEAVPEYAGCAAAIDAAARAKADIAKAKSATHVDYAKVAEIKVSVLGKVFDAFRSDRAPDAKRRRAAFACFCAEGGESLRRFALFTALSERFAGQPWQEWPQGYRHPDTPEVAAFANDNAERIDFYRFLEWLGEEQLAAVQAKAEALGLPIGLYRDLAVGCAREGSDAWGAQDVICMQVKVGCPPDPFNMLGQDWQVPPLHPLALRDAGYEPFIRLLRANMRNTGALRIDHVMGLLHLFWIPAEDDPRGGAYVQYPFEDLMAILAIESHRNHCLVVGEDLGTVPEGFREQMTAANILSYRLFYFEKAEDRFKTPEEFPDLALACVTTHDLATLKGFWSGADIALKESLKLYPSADAMEAEKAARVHDRWLMLTALQAMGLLPPDRDPNNVDGKAMDGALVAALHAYLAQSPAKILLVQVDDLMLEDEQINLPGTVDERPNWRRKLAKPVSALPKLAAMRALAPALKGRRFRSARPSA